MFLQIHSLICTLDAEITEHELIKAEEEATHEALELSQRQKEDWYDIENHLRDLTINKDLAIRKVKSLGGKVKMIREGMEMLLFRKVTSRVQIWKKNATIFKTIEKMPFPRKKRF